MKHVDLVIGNAELLSLVVSAKRCDKQCQLSKLTENKTVESGMTTSNTNRKCIRLAVTTMLYRLLYALSLVRHSQCVINLCKVIL